MNLQDQSVSKISIGVGLRPFAAARPTALISQWVCFAGLYRAVGFTRRYQSATGLLKDECRERWDARRLPKSLRIESIRREILPCPDEQQQKEQDITTADGMQQPSRVELRGQKRTAGAAIAAATWQLSNNYAHAHALLEAATRPCYR